MHHNLARNRIRCTLCDTERHGLKSIIIVTFFNIFHPQTWMRLHFWAMRESGLCDASPSFHEYYVKFIGHFVSVYERKAPPFTREADRWSANPDNIKKYYDDGKKMTDLIGLSHQQALKGLPNGEASSAGDWPYC